MQGPKRTLQISGDLDCIEAPLENTFHMHHVGQKHCSLLNCKTGILLYQLSLCLTVL